MGVLTTGFRPGEYRAVFTGIICVRGRRQAVQPVAVAAGPARHNSCERIATVPDPTDLKTLTERGLNAFSAVVAGRFP